MAKPPKYSDIDLMIAVQEYAKEFPGKIIISELASWASKNYPTLYGVKDVNFRRPHRNGKGGKEIISKPCYRLIKEINLNRSVLGSDSYNPLLQSSSVTAFIDLPQSEQLLSILKTRERVALLSKEKQDLLHECQILRSENKTIRTTVSEISKKIDCLQKDLEHFKETYSMLAMTIDEKRRKKTLAEIGVDEDMLDPVQAVKSMTLRLTEIRNAFSFDQIRAFDFSGLQNLDEKIDSDSILRRNVIENINFGGDT